MAHENLIMGVDPGSKNNGWTVYDIDRRCFTIFGISTIPEFHTALLRNPVKRYIVEDYRVRAGTPRYSGHSHQWNPVVPVRVIGAIEYAAFLNGSEVVLQQTNDKPLGYMLLGRPYVKGKKDMHYVDAMAHVAVWLHRNGGYNNVPRSEKD